MPASRPKTKLVTFLLFTVRCAPDAAAEAPAALPVHLSELASPTPAKARLVVAFVEDNAFLREAYGNLFAGEDTQLFDGPADWARALDADPALIARLDAVVTDMHFDGDRVTGLDVARELRRHVHFKGLVIVASDAPGLTDAFDLALDKDDVRPETLRRALALR